LLKIKNEKIVALLVGFLTFSCSSNTGKPHFLKKLSETLLTTDGSQVAFQDILRNTKEKRWS
jgi:hypothetical protein